MSKRRRVLSLCAQPSVGSIVHSLQCVRIILYLNYSLRRLSSNAIMCSRKSLLYSFPMDHHILQRKSEAQCASKGETNMKCNIWSGRGSARMAHSTITNLNASSDSSSFASFFSPFFFLLFGAWHFSCLWVDRGKCKKYTLDWPDTEWKITIAHQRPKIEGER